MHIRCAVVYICSLDSYGIFLSKEFVNTKEKKALELGNVVLRNSSELLLKQKIPCQSSPLTSKIVWHSNTKNLPMAVKEMR